MTTTNPTQEFYAVEDYVPPTDLGPMPELGEPGVDDRERWKRIVIDGLATDYEISDYGRVLNPQGRLLKINYPGGPNAAGWVGITVDGRSKAIRIDKLVLWMFGGKDPEGMTPMHVNDDPRDCRFDNLTWESTKEMAQRRAAKSVQTKRARAKEGAPTPTKRPSRRRRTATKQSTPKSTPKRGSAEVEVVRLYRCQDIAVTVSLDGSGELSKGSSKMRLSAAQMSALGMLMARVSEMNNLLGLGK